MKDRAPIAIPILLALPLLSLSSCSSVKVPQDIAPSPRPAAMTEENWDPPQINSNRPRVVEYDGDDGDSRSSTRDRGWGELDRDLGAAGIELSPMADRIRN